MSILSRLFGRGTPGSSSGAVMWLYVRCDRCGEKIRVRLNRATDAQQEYDDNGRFTHYYLRKEILGNNCPALMTAELHLNPAGRTIDQQAFNCRIIDEQEFAAP